ncbi:BCL-6 corepressor-like protein 1 isoform X1 [Sinocyclocheilus rhinocerous]|uniref:BCL-6 corepressor-like protein 1 isoform X1 n=1 Tax=Sinocyclocheilus rhinocerous TaxID=307959 RepID=UPI0007B98A74|nr:PREDICTED: BCL-6 corepressor-like protein 1 isoform X1 [Sinocyclocheilus rhinocerous]
MNWAENLLSSIRQDGRPLARYVEEFVEFSHLLREIRTGLILSYLISDLSTPTHPKPATKTSTSLNIGIIFFAPEATPVPESAPVFRPVKVSAPVHVPELLNMALPPEFLAPILSPVSAPAPEPPSSPLVPSSPHSSPEPPVIGHVFVSVCPYLVQFLFSFS